jgi:hypothetical protein
MEKHIMRWSYWLGVACVALAIVARILNAFGLPVTIMETRGNSISFATFLQGAILFLITSIASSGFLLSKRQNS